MMVSMAQITQSIFSLIFNLIFHSESFSITFVLLIITFIWAWRGAKEKTKKNKTRRPRVGASSSNTKSVIFLKKKNSFCFKTFHWALKLNEQKLKEFSRFWIFLVTNKSCTFSEFSLNNFDERIWRYNIQYFIHPLIIGIIFHSKKTFDTNLKASRVAANNEHIFCVFFLTKLLHQMIIYLCCFAVVSVCCVIIIKSGFMCLTYALCVFPRTFSNPLMR